MSHNYYIMNERAWKCFCNVLKESETELNVNDASQVGKAVSTSDASTGKNGTKQFGTNATNLNNSNKDGVDIEIKGNTPAELQSKLQKNKSQNPAFYNDPSNRVHFTLGDTNGMQEGKQKVISITEDKLNSFILKTAKRIVREAKNSEFGDDNWFYVIRETDEEEGRTHVVGKTKDFNKAMNVCYECAKQGIDYVINNLPSEFQNEYRYNGNRNPIHSKQYGEYQGGIDGYMLYNPYNGDMSNVAGCYVTTSINPAIQKTMRVCDRPSEL